MLHQQSIVMTPAQNQIQDELQRKHEELQQLIVHQQEELRRVSEQLFIARYGILTPLLNVCFRMFVCFLIEDSLELLLNHCSIVLRFHHCIL